MSSASLVAVRLDRLAIDPETPSIRRMAAHDVLWNVELIEQILPCTSPATFICFSKTCRTARALVNEWTRRVFDINKHLVRFFSDPRAFRALQASTGTLISGSNALQFLDRTVYEDSDLDLYLSVGVELVVGQYLQGEGYAFAPSNSQSPDFEEQILNAQDSDDELSDYWGGSSSDGPVPRVYNFERLSPDRRLRRKVQLVVTEDSPLQRVLKFHSTCVMNFITHRHAYSLFPRGTFQKRISLELPSSNSDEARRKYTERGWRFVETHDDSFVTLGPFKEVYSSKTRSSLGLCCEIHKRHGDTPRAPIFRLGSRWIDDGHSWVLDLDMTWSGSSSGRIPDVRDPSGTSISLDFDPIRCNNFALLGTPNRYCYILYAQVNSESLKYTYLLSDLEWCEALSEKLTSYKTVTAAQAPESGDGNIFYADLRLMKWRTRYVLKFLKTQTHPHALRMQSLPRTVRVGPAWTHVTFTKPPFKWCGKSPNSDVDVQLGSDYLMMPRMTWCTCEACATALRAHRARQEKKIAQQQRVARAALTQRGRGRGRAAGIPYPFTGRSWGQAVPTDYIDSEHAVVAGGFHGGPTASSNAGAVGLGGMAAAQREGRGRGWGREQVYDEHPSATNRASRGGRGAYLSTRARGRGVTMEAQRGFRGRGRGRGQASFDGGGAMM